MDNIKFDKLINKLVLREEITPREFFEALRWAQDKIAQYEKALKNIQTSLNSVYACKEHQWATKLGGGDPASLPEAITFCKVCGVENMED